MKSISLSASEVAPPCAGGGGGLRGIALGRLNDPVMTGVLVGPPSIFP